MEDIKKIIINGFKVSFISDDMKNKYIKEINKSWDKNFSNKN